MEDNHRFLVKLTFAAYKARELCYLLLRFIKLTGCVYRDPWSFLWDVLANADH